MTRLICRRCKVEYPLRPHTSDPAEAAAQAESLGWLVEWCYQGTFAKFFCGRDCYFAWRDKAA